MSVLLSGLALVSGAATEAEAATPSFDLSGSLRYRYVTIDDGAFAEDGVASTYQLLVKATVDAGNGFGFVLEGRHVDYLGPDDVNDTLNGKTQFPVEVDPPATEISEGYVSFTNSGFSSWAGRRKVNWSNRRFVSTLGWRQNEMSYDGAGFEVVANEDITFRYQFAFNVNRPQSEDSPVGNFEGQFHFAEAVMSFSANQTLTAYAFNHDFDDVFAQGLSARTYGANWTASTGIGESLTGRAILEYARQSDIGTNPNSFEHDYVRLEAQLQGQNWRVRAGQEILAGDGTTAFRTPFGLLHAYNGWADRFLATPANGLRDIYVGANFTVPEEVAFSGTTLALTYHDFASDNGNLTYGTEWDAAITVPVRDDLSVQFKTARYNADGFSSDSDKFWVTIRATF